MGTRQTAVGSFVSVAVLVAMAGAGVPASAQDVGPIGAKAEAQLRAIYADKASWTIAERKLATSLLYAGRRSRGLAMVRGIGSLDRTANRAGVAADGTVVVHIRGEVTDALLRTIASVGGEVARSLPELGLVRARVPVARLEAIAELPEVRSIRPPSGFVHNAGSQTTQGDTAHAAAAMRTNYSVNGTGVKVGILSTGVDSMAARQATGDLPPTCTNPPGAGACVKVAVPQCASLPCGFDDGTAMMEVIHDLAPGAQLYFAGTDLQSSEEEFAANIRTLRNTYGCDIIVDDISFLAESAFQDGPIAQAVSEVKNAGALYFSSAGNSGRKRAGTSGTWEGDFADSGTRIPVISDDYGGDLPVHSFGGANTTQLCPSLTPGLICADLAITLKWSDPLRGATNDYDVWTLSSDLSELMDSSIDDQGITEEPYEEMGWGYAGERIAVVRFGHVVTPGQPAVPGGGSARALRLDTNWGQLSLNTARATYGHNAADAAVTVAATDARIPGGSNPFVGGATNPVETYSSDGPRRIFYNANGSAITPGNVLFSTGGGRDIRKPDITAADCVTTTTPGFAPYCGTSAAAAHAAGIAALLRSLPNHPGSGQILTAMMTSALDVTPVAGWDRDSGVGIVMANRAANALTTLPNLDYFTVDPCRVLDSRLTGGPLLCGVERTVTMAGTCGVPADAKVVSFNITATEEPAPGNLRVYAAGSPAPTASTLNYVPWKTQANNAIAPLNAAGQMAVLCSPTGTTQIIVDVTGYFK